MKISGIKAVYFSAVGNTRRVVEAIAIMLSDELGVSVETVERVREPSDRRIW